MVPPKTCQKLPRCWWVRSKIRHLMKPMRCRRMGASSHMRTSQTCEDDACVLKERPEPEGAVERGFRPADK